MLFGREVDDPARSGQAMCLGYEHLSGSYFLGLAGCCICKEVFLVLILEHQRDALAHHADRVDGVHQRLGTGFQQVALYELHGGFKSEVQHPGFQ